jgi:arylsulfatase A-like enzyme
MAESPQNPAPAEVTRRNFLVRSALAAAAPVTGALGLASADPAAPAGASAPVKRPNIIIYHSDQFRWDFICAAGHNPMSFTPNLDAMYRRGTVFANFMTNQPLCCPSRACLWTGQYATTSGVWKNSPLHLGATTLATQLTAAGYSANYIGKWHLGNKGPAVPLEGRGGFTGYWRVANCPEISTRPYEGEFWDENNKAVPYKDVYRVDFLTGLAEDFLRQKHEQPFLLVLAQVEPHQQNGKGPDGEPYGFSPPKGYEKQFRNPYIPPDLRDYPGDWPDQLANYYGDCKAIDESVGRIFQTLKEQNLEDDTIVIFMSDHGCHFRTRNTEYKRSPHDASIHVPFMIAGPGFDNNRVIPELVSMVDVMPTLLDLLGLPIPASVQGRSFLPLVNDPAAREQWRNEVFVQVSEAEVARALRTDEWTYVALAPQAHPGKESASLQYQDYQLYNNRSDPAQKINLIGRIDNTSGETHYAGTRTLEQVTTDLRQRLIARMVGAGEAKPEIAQWLFYP